MITQNIVGHPHCGFGWKFTILEVGVCHKQVGIFMIYANNNALQDQIFNALILIARRNIGLIKINKAHIKLFLVIILEWLSILLMEGMIVVKVLLILINMDILFIGFIGLLIFLANGERSYHGIQWNRYLFRIVRQLRDILIVVEC